MSVPPIIILFRPQLGENIGKAARAMLNFGLTEMRLVAPRDGWPNQKAVVMASGAGRLLDEAGVFADVAHAAGDCTYVFATTARQRACSPRAISQSTSAAMADPDASPRAAAARRHCSAPGRSPALTCALTMVATTYLSSLIPASSSVWCT